MAEKKSTRRRGKALEDAVLSTVWAQLNKVGYEKLTISDIATLAGTNKNTLYRHWPTKAVMVISAFSKYGPEIKFEQPDTGNLSDDLFGLFAYFQNALKTLTTGMLEGVLLDRLHDITLDRVTASLGERSEDNRFAKIMLTILNHAADRGEVDMANINSSLIGLPLVLLASEILTKGGLSDDAVDQLVTQILLPVYLNSTHQH